MKKLIISLLASLALSTVAQQTNGLLGTVGLTLSPLLQASNYSFEPYGTYAEDAPKGQKWGGGLFAIYNVNQYLGTGIGFDYLGQFTMVSANVTLKAPIKPFLGIAGTNNSFGQITVTPFAIAGIGTPFSGSSTQAIAISDVGGAVSFGHLWGGQFNAGLAYGRWDNAGAYSGPRYHIFAGWSKGF